MSPSRRLASLKPPKKARFRKFDLIPRLTAVLVAAEAGDVVNERHRQVVWLDWLSVRLFVDRSESLTKRLQKENTL